MPSTQQREHLIAYDIANPKRLARVHRLLKRIALPVQYSLFYTKLSDQQRDKLAALLEKLIHPREDDIRIYPLPSQYQALYLGQAPLMEGLQLDWKRGDWHNGIDDVLRDAALKNARKTDP
ncbi:MAG: CRISPR-associated endonuclease Cas2 [Thiotrichales bacterium]